MGCRVKNNAEAKGRARAEAGALVIAAPTSGSGKTTLTLALLRAFRDQGLAITSAKSGPDYIDPGFHAAASLSPCLNLDAWAMCTDQLRDLASRHMAGQDVLVIEGAMGLFDGSAAGGGSVADLSANLGAPVVLVVDCARQAQSVAALVHGFRSFRNDVEVAGVILNRVASERHEKMLRQALNEIDCPVLGAMPKSGALVLPERHLGLVQASEHQELESFISKAAQLLKDHVDLEALIQIARPITQSALKAKPETPGILAPLGQRIAIASDVAFSFRYHHLLEHWQAAGAELSFCSPLANEAPDEKADAIYLPGGYPELHAATLAAASTFKSAMGAAASKGVLIYGECGGYMTLGRAVIDANSVSHPMLDLLPLVTSFASRKRHLGYRLLTPRGSSPWAGKLAAHEFHYASIVEEGQAERLFAASDATGAELPDMGLKIGNVMGSFAHVLCQK